MKTTNLIEFAKGGTLEKNQSLIFTVQRDQAGNLVTSCEFFADSKATNGQKVLAIHDQETKFKPGELTRLIETVRQKLLKLQPRVQGIWIEPEHRPKQDNRVY